MMNKQDDTRIIPFAEAEAVIPGPLGERAISCLRRGSLEFKLSRPLPPNQQTPHAQVEDFSEDLAVWVVFYGPSGGELPG